MVFKHLVLPGGGSNGIIDMGIIFYCLKNNIINMENIQSIHATSVGSISAILLCLASDYNEIETYIVNCMMDKCFYVDPDNIVNIMQAKGLINNDCFPKLLGPFFDANNIDINITLKDFYNINKKELYFYATRVKDVETVCFSHHDFPDLKLIDAIQGSCALPGIITPTVYENNIYIDGGVITNYPIEECLLKENVEPNEVLGINHVFPPPESCIDVNNFNIFGLMFYMLCCVVEKIIVLITNNKYDNKITEKKALTTQVNMYMDKYLLTFSELMEGFQSKDMRKQNIERGYEFARKHFENA